MPTSLSHMFRFRADSSPPYPVFRVVLGRKTITSLVLGLAGVAALGLVASPGAGHGQPSSNAISPSPAYWGDPVWTLDKLAVDPKVRALDAAYDAQLLAAANGVTPAASSSEWSVVEIVAPALLSLKSSGRRAPSQRLASRGMGQVSGVVSPSVFGAINRATVRTGVSSAYLLRVGMRESGLNPDAEAASSTATGLFQFIESTWLLALKAYGARHGLEAAADAITIDAAGRPSIRDPQVRAYLLQLRLDPEISAIIAAEHTREDASILRAALGRDASAGELYAAHVLGSAGALRLFRAVRRSPWVSGASLFPEAAAGNSSLFYVAGSPRSAAGLAAELLRRGET